MRTNYFIFTFAIALGFPARAEELEPIQHEQSELGSSLSGDCTRSGDHYTFLGHGQGNSQSLATQGSLLSARKNALICLFGGTLNFTSETAESNTDTSYTGKTSISVSAENIDWSGFEMARCKDDELNGVWQSDAVFNWSVKDIEKNRRRLDLLNKKKEENRALSAKIKAARDLAAQKESLLQRQRIELNRLKKQEQDIANMQSESERIIAKLRLRKKSKLDKDNQWLNMARQLGCGVTLGDLIASIGKPAKTIIQFEELDIKYHTKFRPKIYFVYGDYALVAPEYDRVASSFDIKYTDYKSDIDRYPVTYVEKYRGSPESWWICQPSS
ncbi:MAG: hypothetical protein NTY08_09945 [Proteobacteria bacterium]|nr:hypothetical protein [Pseudomonadota bacterium]